MRVAFDSRPARDLRGIGRYVRSLLPALRETAGEHEIVEAPLEIVDHVDGSVEEVSIQQSTGGHGGGDDAMMEAFCQAVLNREAPRTGAEESWESHLVGFLAEEARVTGRLVDVTRYRSLEH